MNIQSTKYQEEAIAARKSFYKIHISASFLICLFFFLIGLLPQLSNDSDVKFNDLMFAGIGTFLIYSLCILFTFVNERK